MEEKDVVEQVEAAEEEVAEQEEETGEEVSATPAEEEVDEDELDEDGQPRKVSVKAVIAQRRKRQEEEARRIEAETKARILEEELERLRTAKPKEEDKAPQTIEEFYDKDPVAATQYINREIAKMAQEDPYGKAEDIERLRDLKLELKERAKVRKQSEFGTFTTEVEKAIPGFSTKAKALTDFAIESGYSMETVMQLSDPSIVGKQRALEFIKAVNKQYDTIQSLKGVPNKTVKTQPTRVESPGTGIPKAKPPSIDKLLEQARATGDYSAVFKAKGLL